MRHNIYSLHLTSLRITLFTVKLLIIKIILNEPTSIPNIILIYDESKSIHVLYNW